MFFFRRHLNRFREWLKPAPRKPAKSRLDFDIVAIHHQLKLVANRESAKSRLIRIALNVADWVAKHVRTTIRRFAVGVRAFFSCRQACQFAGGSIRGSQQGGESLATFFGQAIAMALGDFFQNSMRFQNR